METITCNQCKAYVVSYDGSRHQCQLGFTVKYVGMNRFIETHEYGPAKRCPRPLTEDKFKELTLNIRIESTSIE